MKLAPEKMAIKASGYQLADISENEGFALVNPEIIKERFLQADDIDAISEEESKEILAAAFIEGKRPSIETFLHSISGKHTLHTHPIVVNALACRKDGKKILAELFPDALIVPYATPGVELAKAYFKVYKEHMASGGAEIHVVFLQNHGVVVSGENADTVIQLTEQITNRIETYLNCDFSGYHDLTHIWQYFPDKILW